MQKKALIVLQIAFCFIILGFIFYLNQRITYISYSFQEQAAAETNGNIKLHCMIPGNWRQKLKQPMHVSTYGAPYELLISAKSNKKILKIELVDLSIQYDSCICSLQNCKKRISKYSKDRNYYISIKDFPVTHNTGEKIKLKYKVKITFPDCIKEKEQETEFIAIKEIERSYIILDGIMSA